MKTVHHVGRPVLKNVFQALDARIGDFLTRKGREGNAYLRLSIDVVITVIFVFITIFFVIVRQV